jgi:hypothetical protein
MTPIDEMVAEFIGEGWGDKLRQMWDRRDPDGIEADNPFLDEGFCVLNEKKSEFEVLKGNKKPLDDAERKKVMDAKAVWHHGPGGAASPAVWKAVHPSGKTTFVCHTHRCYQKADTVEKAIDKFHRVVKDTA